MSKRLLPNRISKTVVPDALSKVRQAIQLLNEAIGEDTPISDDDYKGLRKIADKLKRTTDDVYEIAKENTDFIEAPLTVEEITKDKTFYEFCDSIFALLKGFTFRVEREQNIAGAEYFNACNVFEGDVADKVDRDKNNVKAQNVLAQLNGIDRSRGGGPNNTKAGEKPAK